MGQLEKAIQQTSKRLRDKWFTQLGLRIKREPKTEGIIRECLNVMLGRWGLLERKDGRISGSQRLVEIGAMLTESREMDARWHLYDAMLRSKRETAFSSSNLLLKIRNSRSDRTFRVTFTMHGRVIRDDKGEHLRGPECRFTHEDGTALNDASFVQDELSTNFRAFDIMVDWGLFFCLLYTSDADDE